ncbi:MAG TPA: GHMP kinase, partial [Candidatus Dormibacteraeota bacterium]|nr:GHMP kinase [Candidatus Dormibacteraeota bacterium]
MLIVRAPMRLSFAGGGTDLPAYYREHGGMVVSTSIDKYVYVFISPNGFGSLQISSSDYSTFFRHAGGEEVEEEGKLRYARAFLRHFGVRAGYSLFMASEMPPGTGLGSSSSLSVALTKALAALRGDVLSKDDVALQASSIEIDKLKMPIGRQDHYASAFGGINAIHFGREEITVESLRVSAATRRWLEDSLMIF